MKTMLMAVIMAVLPFFAASAQDVDKKKMTKKERKIMQDRIDSLYNAEAGKAIDDTAFVIEADEVVFKRGYTAHVTSTTNFVAVCGDKAVFQVAFNVPWSGFNGLGGITVEGNVSRYEKKKDKKGNTYIQMGVSGRAISAQLFITLWSGGNKASVNIQQNFYSGRITLNGTMVPAEQSTVFKGTTL